MYSEEPQDKIEFTKKYDRAYGSFSRAYDWAVKALPLWRNWISTTIPHIIGPDVLEVSFGTGYLISQYANQYNTYGIDYNWELACIAQQNLQKFNVRAALQQADIEFLPYPNDTFDTVVNTMAFTGYPNGLNALNEIHRVLKPKGRFVLVDIDYPQDRNWLGTLTTQVWAFLGDIIRDMEALFKHTGFQFTYQEIGGFGSVHLYIATKPDVHHLDLGR
ncbi:class I SAM-dependent methyltransferase [Chloroflexota bacterium]